MSGECKSYRLNKPMTWDEFRSMPDDIQVTYIKLLREKYNVPDKNLAEMFRVNKDYIYRTFKKLGLQRDVRISHPKWDKDGFYAWMNGVDKLPTLVPEDPTEVPVIEEVPIEAPILEELEVFVEDDLPVEEPDPTMDEYNLEINFLKSEVEALRMVNEELVAVHEKDKERIGWLEVRVDELGVERLMLEKQMEVVRMIFGGKNNG